MFAQLRTGFRPLAHRLSPFFQRSDIQTRGIACCFTTSSHTSSVAFRHLPPNSARFGYATEGALFISAQLSTDAVSALRKVWIKPVLNWANVCSLNILRTVRRTMIRFLIELLVRRTWFGQSKLYFVLNWLVIRCKLRPELVADALQTA